MVTDQTNNDNVIGSNRHFLGYNNQTAFVLIEFPLDAGKHDKYGDIDCICAQRLSIWKVVLIVNVGLRGVERDYKGSFRADYVFLSCLEE